MIITVKREKSNSECTFGRLYIDGVEKCYTLEDVVRDVKIAGETAIPKGSYTLELQAAGEKHEKYKEKFKDNPGFHKGMIHIKDVPNYAGVLIHIGNTKADTRGCILLGKGKDTATNSITNSSAAYEELYPIIRDAILKDGAKIIIEQIDETIHVSNTNMATFETALKVVLEHEGGYVNDPSDPGGETYKGVARKMHSSWQGWVEVDMAKRQSNFPKNLEQNSALQDMIHDFYRINFWDKVQGSHIENEQVAQVIFDFAVNAGVSTSASLVQKVLDVTVDGTIGPKTIAALNTFPAEHFIASFTLMKIARYVAIVNKRPESKKYFYGWVCRALNC